MAAIKPPLISEPSTLNLSIVPEVEKPWVRYLKMFCIGFLIVVGILALVVLMLYGTYYRYSLLTGDKDIPYTLTTGPASNSYTDLNGNNVAIIWPIGSIKYVPNEAAIEHNKPLVMAPQYLPAISGGSWPTTFTYSLLYSNTFGPYTLSTAQTVTTTPPNGISSTVIYPVGTPVTAKLDKKLNLICQFEGKGNPVKMDDAQGVQVLPQEAAWQHAEDDYLQHLSE